MAYVTKINLNNNKSRVVLIVMNVQIIGCDKVHFISYSILT